MRKSGREGVSAHTELWSGGPPPAQELLLLLLFDCRPLRVDVLYCCLTVDLCMWMSCAVVLLCVTWLDVLPSRWDSV